MPKISKQTQTYTVLVSEDLFLLKWIHVRIFYFSSLPGPDRQSKFTIILSGNTTYLLLHSLLEQRQILVLLK